jgi:hypothetical protein
MWSEIYITMQEVNEGSSAPSYDEHVKKEHAVGT